MSENPTCPYCGSIVPADSRQLNSDEKVQMRCRSCGGVFEYLPGFGAFSLPGQESRKSSSSDDGSFPGTIYEGDAPYTIERPPQQQSACGTCCTLICCLIGLFIILPLLLFSGGLFTWLFG
jgi:hypothetical protein